MALSSMLSVISLLVLCLAEFGSCVDPPSTLTPFISNISPFPEVTSPHQFDGPGNHGGFNNAFENNHNMRDQIRTIHPPGSPEFMHHLDESRGPPLDLLEPFMEKGHQPFFPDQQFLPHPMDVPQFHESRHEPRLGPNIHDERYDMGREEFLQHQHIQQNQPTDRPNHEVEILPPRSNIVRGPPRRKPQNRQRKRPKSEERRKVKDQEPSEERRSRPTTQQPKKSHRKTETTTQKATMKPVQHTSTSKPRQKSKNQFSLQHGTNGPLYDPNLKFGPPVNHPKAHPPHQEHRQGHSALRSLQTEPIVEVREENTQHHQQFDQNEAVIHPPMLPMDQHPHRLNGPPPLGDIPHHQFPEIQHRPLLFSPEHEEKLNNENVQFIPHSVMDDDFALRNQAPLATFNEHQSLTSTPTPSLRDPPIHLNSEQPNINFPVIRPEFIPPNVEFHKEGRPEHHTIEGFREDPRGFRQQLGQHLPVKNLDNAHAGEFFNSAHHNQPLKVVSFGYTIQHPNFRYSFSSYPSSNRHTRGHVDGKDNSRRESLIDTRNVDTNFHPKKLDGAVSVPNAQSEVVFHQYQAYGHAGI